MCSLIIYRKYEDVKMGGGGGGFRENRKIGGFKFERALEYLY